VRQKQLQGFSGTSGIVPASICVCLLKAWSLFLLGSLGLAFLTQGSIVQAQSKGALSSVPPLLTRTTTRREARRFGYGGTFTIVGAPQGSITIEGWTRNEVEIIANIEQQARTEQELNTLTTVNGFVFSEDFNHLQVLTVGTHDKVYMKRVAPRLPKELLGLPWKIDYRIRVPVVTDVELNAGRGPLKVTGVEGALRITATETEGQLALTGGVVSAMIAAGNILVTIPVRSWRGGGADIRLATGQLTVELPSGFNGDIDADVLRIGGIEESFGGLEPRERRSLTERTLRARAGSGGAFFKFMVGDGKLHIKKLTGG